MSLPENPPTSSFPRLVDKKPTTSAREIADHLVPPPQFADASFDSYVPDAKFPSQSEARQYLDNFAASIRNGSSRGGGLFRKKKPQPTIEKPGVYLDGGFGVGKTHLLAALWHAVPGRKYFGTFIEYTALVGALGYADAAELLSGCSLVCIDEFELDDPGDTMIMTRLLSELVDKGARIAATSNTPPNALGEGRFASEDFVREIQALASHVTTIRIDGVDYRHRGVDGRATMRSREEALEIADEYARRGMIVTADSFPELLSYLGTIHPSRYITALDGTGAVVWTGVTPITNQTDALRLVAFVDRMYDAQITLLAEGQPLDTVFSEEMLGGGYRKKYLRALSRLIAMTSAPDFEHSSLATDGTSATPQE